MVPNKVTIHRSLTPNLKMFKGGGWKDEITRWHINERGWRTIGYHIVINPDGEVEYGRPLNRQGAHVAGHNKNNIGICMVGTDAYTGRAWDSLRYCLHGLTQSYDIYPEHFYCHNQFDLKNGCPGFSIQKLLAWYCAGRWDAIRDHWIKDSFLVRMGSG